MFPILRQHWTLWSAWIAVSAILLFANPWIEFSWAELAACFGPLLIAVDRRLRRERLLVIGLVGITLLAVVDSTAISIGRMLLDTVVLIGGILLGARAVDDQIELESIAGHLALGPDPARAFREFKRSIEREVGRARRHDRSFVVLSVAPTAQAIARSAPAAAADSRIMARIAEARWILELADLLAQEVHLYAEVVATQDRVLCLVPEVESSAIDALVSRLESACQDHLAISVETGRASFPRDALGVEDLIEVADRARLAPKLESLPAAPAEEVDASVSTEHSRAVGAEKGGGASLRDANS